MGTNYTLLEDACDKCGRGEPRHIGKSSAGWCFGLHVYPDDGINDLPDWEKLWNKRDAKIVDEYEREIAPDQMKAIITERESNALLARPDWWYTENHAEQGPNGLARAKVDGRHTIKHGSGTWDCHVGEFS